MILDLFSLAPPQGSFGARGKSEWGILQTDFRLFRRNFFLLNAIFLSSGFQSEGLRLAKNGNFIKDSSRRVYVAK